jgi:hypothetical protein
MSMREEVRKIAEIYNQEGRAIMAAQIVEEAKDKDKYPSLHAHLWEVAADVLADEARIARAHRLLISIHFTTEEGVTTRLLMHTPGQIGYRPATHVARSVDLAALKLRQMAEDIGRARARFRDFKAIVPSEVADEVDQLLEQAEKKAIEGIAARETGVAA